VDHRFEQLEERMSGRFEQMQQQIDYRFDRVDRELTDLLDNTIKASGEASVALVRHENVQRQFAEMELEVRELKARIRKLEEKA
jgi:pantothenate kinase